MTVERNVADAIQHQVTLEVECIDRLYPNLYQPLLQPPGGAAQTLSVCPATAQPTTVFHGKCEGECQTRNLGRSCRCFPSPAIRAIVCMASSRRSL